MAKRNEMICGCHTDRDGVVFCELHSRAGRMAALLDAIRKYFVEREDLGGERSPIVLRIDQLIPRRAPAPLPPREDDDDSYDPTGGH
jgi:hypothetical protein